MTTSAGHPTRTPDLAGLLVRRPASAAKPPLTTPAEPTAVDATATESAPRRSLTAVPPAATSSQAPPRRQYLRSITVYLPRKLFVALGDAATERETSRTALILTAINATHERLGAVLNTAPPRGAGLFEVPQDRKTAGKPSVQTTMRVSDAQLDALSELAKQYNAARSHVIAAAVTLHLAV